MAKLQNAVNWIARYIKDVFGPFIDADGKVLCHIPRREPGALLVPIEDPQVRNVLLFAHADEIQVLCSKKAVQIALQLVQGELWDGYSGTAGPIDPVVKLLVTAAEERESYVGSATELLGLLRDVNRRHQVLRGREQLPGNEDALGIALSKGIVMLRSYGIRLERGRSGKSRFWEFRRLDPVTDTCDTFHHIAQARTHAVSTDAIEKSEPLVTRGALNETQKRLMQIYEEGAPHEAT